MRVETRKTTLSSARLASYETNQIRKKLIRLEPAVKKKLSRKKT